MRIWVSSKCHIASSLLSWYGTWIWQFSALFQCFMTSFSVSDFLLQLSSAVNCSELLLIQIWFDNNKTLKNYKEILFKMMWSTAKQLLPTSTFIYLYLFHLHYKAQFITLSLATLHELGYRLACSTTVSKTEAVITRAGQVHAKGPGFTILSKRLQKWQPIVLHGMRRNSRWRVQPSRKPRMGLSLSYCPSSSRNDTQ